MRNRPILALLLVLSALSLPGCGATPVIVEKPRLVIPETLKSCPVQPPPPADDADDTALANWIADLADAGQSCRATLKSLLEAIGQ